MAIKCNSGEMQEHFKKVIEGLANDTMGKIDRGKKGYLNWIDFKEYKTAISEQKESLIRYISSLE